MLTTSHWLVTHEFTDSKVNLGYSTQTNLLVPTSHGPGCNAHITLLKYQLSTLERIKYE